ncbi:MAG: HAD family hydrolase [Planctomycetota bacterium]|nr:MAG: HAD family hydrolase [Planctomycetota bacterium]
MDGASGRAAARARRRGGLVRGPARPGPGRGRDAAPRVAAALPAARTSGGQRNRGGGRTVRQGVFDEPVRTLFLDAGNTLVGLDHDWIAQQLAAIGIALDPRQLERAEAAARPAVSRALGRHGTTEGRDAFAIYLDAIAAELERRGAIAARDRARLARDLLPRLRDEGGPLRLWGRPLPGAREALERAAERGIGRVVVSNSDGTVHTLLERAGMLPWIEHVVDSHHVGAEKPDPAIFRHALAISGADPRTTLHVGDLYHADIVGAHRAGLRAVLLDPFGDWNGVEAPTVPDVRTLVQRITAG